MSIEGKYKSNSPEETEELGRTFADELNGGEVFAFHGDLGSGKTVMIRGIAMGLECDEREVSSPSYVLVQEYSGRVPVFHIDLYRLLKLNESDYHGLMEMVFSEGVTLIEWAERAPDLIPPDAYHVKIEKTGKQSREIVISRVNPEQISKE